MPSQDLDEKAIFAVAISISTTEARESYLDQVCENGGDIRSRVELLLRMQEEEPEFLERPAQKVAPTMLLPNSQSSAVHRIGPYKIREKIAEGGMGTVYVAQQTKPVRRTVALKVIRSGMAGPNVVARFETERQALAMMDHPNIARVLDGGATEDELPYFVMELVQGLPINEYCDRKQQTIRQRLELFVGVCSAVQHAHQKGIIHRDLKPSNILVAEIDGVAVPKVIDFGVAKAVAQKLTDKTVYTQFSQLVGTPLYMSPEQAGLGVLDVDTRSDVYSLGAVLYELLTGETYVHRETLKNAPFDEMRRIIQEEEPLRPSAMVSTLAAEANSTVAERPSIDARHHREAVSCELDWIVMKALEKDRNRRYPSARDLGEDLERYLHGEAVSACPTTFGYRLKKMAIRHKSAFVMTALVACVLLVATSASLVQAVRATEAEKVAEAGLQNERDARLAEQKAREAAEKAEELALQNAATSYRRQYQAEMSLGHADLKAGNLVRLHQNLASHLPRPERKDLRGWEWDYLLSQCNLGRKLCEHNWEVSSIAWSPDGHLLATASYDGDAIVWDARSGRRLHRFSFGGTLKRGLSWSPDSKRLAWGSAADESAIRIWDRDTAEIKVLLGHTLSLLACSWSPNGKRLATTSFDGTTGIWDVETGDRLLTLESGGSRIVLWKADGEKIITTRGTQLNVWDADTGLCEQVPQQFMNGIHSAALTNGPSQQLLLLGGGSKCQLVNAESWTMFGEVVHRQGNVQAVAFSPNGEEFASAGSDGRVIIWDTQSKQQRDLLQAPHGDIRSLAWNPNGHLLAAGCIDGAVVVWQVPSSQMPSELVSPSSPVNEILWKNRDSELTILSGSTFTGGGNRTVWDPTLQEMTATDSLAPGVRRSWSPNGKLSAQTAKREAQTCYEIEIADNQGQIIRTLRFTNAYRVPEFCWSHDSQYLLAYYRQRLDVWNVLSGNRVFTWEGPHIARVVWAPDNHRVAVVGGGDRTDNGTQQGMSHVHVFDINSKTRVLKHRFHKHRVTATAVAWHPAGVSLAAGNENGVVSIWDFDSGRESTLVHLHSSTIQAIDWHPDGKRIASIGGNGELKIWDPADGAELLEIRDNFLSTAKWSSDGTKLAAGNESGRVRIWSTAGVQDKNQREQRRELAMLYATRAEKCLDSGEVSHALSDLTTVIELAPGDLTYRRSRAELLVREGQLQKALAELSIVLDIDPDDKRVLMSRLRILATLGRWNEALTDVSRFDELVESPDSRYLLAVVQLKLGDLDGYRETCQQQLKDVSIDAVDSGEIQSFTIALARGAISDYQKLFELFPKRGPLLYRAGRLEDAIDLLTDEQRVWAAAGSLELPSDSTDQLPAYTWYFLAMACHELGRYPESARWFEKAEAYSVEMLDLSTTGSSPLSWNQIAVLEILQSEARRVLGFEKADLGETD